MLKFELPNGNILIIKNTKNTIGLQVKNKNQKCIDETYCCPDAVSKNLKTNNTETLSINNTERKTNT